MIDKCPKAVVGLNDFVSRNRPGLTDCLAIFIALCEAIRRIHAKGLVHNDINGDTCRISGPPSSAMVLLSDLSVHLSKDGWAGIQEAGGRIGGQLAYISPERTGRTPHGVDFRSDCYSLGVVLYKLLTGRLPFDFQEPLKTIHAHIAQTPVPVSEIDERIPQLLSRITSKLLAKHPADRYQGVTGLIFDLKECLRQLQINAAIEPFPLAQRDVSPIFEIPTRLYGRYREVQLLCDGYRQVAAGDIGAFFIKGPPGAGKSFLVNHIQPFLLEERGYFISGKFDQYEQTIPCSAIVQAFSGLIRRLLTLSEEGLDQWRAIILDAVGDNGQLIIDVIPELELVIGKQPVPCRVSSVEARNRFSFLFRKFVRSIAREDDPLIVFLDDLQWADRASLELMESVFLDNGLGHVFLIGAYRDLEVLENPFLEEFLESIARQKPETQFLLLEPVDEEYIGMLVKDMFAIDVARHGAFIRLVMEKTGCNPLFIREFLISLHQEGMIRFAFAEKEGEADRWQIDQAAVAEARPPESMVALLTRRIKKLSEETQAILSVAACIGTTFAPHLLTAANSRPLETIRAHLQEACGQGMLVAFKGQYKFIHDRVREAAYQLMDAPARIEIHYAVGKALAGEDPEESTEDIFLAASQWNLARGRLRPEEALALIRLNLAAGRKAKQFNAYTTAQAYFHTGIELLGADGWQWNYHLALALHTEAAETAYMCANLEAAEKQVALVLAKARSDLDRVGAYEIRISCLSSQNRFAEMLREGGRILSCLGYRLPANPGKLRLLWELAALKWSLRGISLQHLRALEARRDPAMLARHHLVSAILLPAYRVRPNLFKFLVLRGLRAALKQGGVPDTAVYYSHFGLFLGMAGDLERGYEWGQLALEMTGLSQMSTHSKVHIRLGVNGLMLLWKKPLRQMLQPLLDTYRFCMESGHWAAAANALAIYFVNLTACGIPLTDIFTKIDHYYGLMGQYQQKTAMEFLLSLRHQLVSIFCGPMDSMAACRDAQVDIDALLASYRAANDRLSHSYICYSNLIANFHKGRYPKAIRYSALALAFLKRYPVSITTLRVWWYDSLARLALIRQNDQRGGANGRAEAWRRLAHFFSRRWHLGRVAVNQRKLKRWACRAPMNLMNKWSLVEAERARVSGQAARAEVYYQSAVRLSREHRFLHEEALANELWARFCIENSQKQAAEIHLKAAIDQYAQWGARIQRDRLLETYHEVLGQPPKIPADRAQAGGTREACDFGNPEAPKFEKSLAELDLQMVADTLGALSHRSGLKSSLVTLSHRLMHYTGAQRVLLLIYLNGAMTGLNGAMTGRNGVMIGVDNRLGEKVIAMVPLPAEMAFPATMVHYVMRTRESLLLEDASATGLFTADPYIRASCVKSALCVPVGFGERLRAILYLENNLSGGVFSALHRKMLERLCSQIALFLDNTLSEEGPRTGAARSLDADRLNTLLQARYGLTPQEARISALFKQGRTRAQICELLHISATTLKKHLQTIYDKTVNLEDDFSGEGRVDKLSRLILFLFKQT